MMHMVRNVSYVIVIMAAVLLGINGLFDYNIVSAIFGEGTVITRIMYALAGLSGVVLLAAQEYQECCACPDTHL